MTPTDSGSTFNGCAAAVGSLQDVANAKMTALTTMDISPSTHVIYAFITEGHQGRIENFHSDRDHGLGLELLKLMKNKGMSNTMCIVRAHPTSDI